MSHTYFILMGATGDLAHTKILPALYALYRQNILPKNFRIIGIGRTKLDVSAYTNTVLSTLKKYEFDDVTLSGFISIIDYQSTIYEGKGLFNSLTALEPNAQSIFFLALPPSAFDDALHAIKYCKEQKIFSTLRIAIEKPFGHDLISAQNLNTTLHSFLLEKEIYRLDHYLGKETVQNILAIRFANTIFDPLLTHEYVEKIELEVLESDGIRDRAQYFDQTGTVKDMLQNHILQLLSLFLMRRPTQITSTGIHESKQELLNSLRPIDLSHVHLGQYKGYLEEKGVADKSQRETFVALTIYSDLAHLKNIPIHIRTGKCMSEKRAEIRVYFKPNHETLFTTSEICQPQANILTINIQPKEEINLTVNAKFPGEGMCINPIKLCFGYSKTQQHQQLEAYARLIHDLIVGDQTLFVQSDEIEQSWRYITSIIEAQEKGLCTITPYDSGITPPFVK